MYMYFEFIINNYHLSSIVYVPLKPWVPAYCRAVLEQVQITSSYDSVNHVSVL